MKQLKIGDHVFVKASRWYAHLSKDKVTNITKACVTVGHSHRWSLKTGRELNTASFFPNTLLQPTPELEALYARQQLIADVCNLLESTGRLVRDDAGGRITDSDLKRLKDVLDSIAHNCNLHT